MKRLFRFLSRNNARRSDRSQRRQRLVDGQRRGESSGGYDDDDDDAKALGQLYCGICMEKKHELECMAPKGCGHAYCVCCLIQYVTSKAVANEATVRCPEPACKDGFLEPDMFRYMLPTDVLDRWGARLCEEVIPATERFYCPYGDCSVLLVDDGGNSGKVNAISECPHCMRQICARCRVPWHAGLRCSKYLTREDRMVMQLAEKNSWRSCPNCGFLVEKTAGCNSMVCRCRHAFCYDCGEPGFGHLCPTTPTRRGRAGNTWRYFLLTCSIGLICLSIMSFGSSLLSS